MHLPTFHAASRPPLHFQRSRRRVEVLSLLSGSGVVHFEMILITAADGR